MVENLFGMLSSLKCSLLHSLKGSQAVGDVKDLQPDETLENFCPYEYVIIA